MGGAEFPYVTSAYVIIPLRVRNEDARNFFMLRGGNLPNQVEMRSTSRTEEYYKINYSTEGLVNIAIACRDTK